MDNSLGKAMRKARYPSPEAAPFTLRNRVSTGADLTAGLLERASISHFEHRTPGDSSTAQPGP